MVERIKNIFSNHKTLIQNFSYLSALQIFNMLLPLITYPYLIRVLGKETYGLIVFAQAVVGYLVILVGFGFNISATKEISIHRDNKEKLSEIVSSIIIIKSLLFVLAIITLSICLNFIPEAKGNKLLFYLTIWVCLYDLIFPTWYFQGIERMKYITYFSLFSRLTFLTLVFIFIHKSEDYLLYPIINGIGALCSGIGSLVIIFYYHKVKFRFQSFLNLKHYFVESIPVFIANFSVQVYLATNKILVGIFLSLSDVAYYDLAEKLLNLFKLPITIISQVIFPKMSKSYDKIFLKKIIGFAFIAVLAGVTIFQFVADNFVFAFAGKDMLPSASVARILIISLIPLIISNGLGIQTLLSQGYNKYYTNTVLQTTGIYFGLISLLILTKQLTVFSLPVVSILIEIFMLFSFYYKCRKLQLI